jgi:hypothetical protein
MFGHGGWRSFAEGSWTEPIGVRPATPQAPERARKGKFRGQAAWAAPQRGYGGGGPDWPARQAVAAGALVPYRVASEASMAFVWAAGRRLGEVQAAKARECRFQADLLRELFSNPFSPAGMEAAWLSRHAGAVRAQANAMYERGQLTRFPLLAEVLRAAGCTSAEVLAHCRRPGPHVRGCWVLDGILGRQ